jgi:hypothetical protein
MSTRAFGLEVEGDSNLKKLCEETGGRVEYPLENLYKDVSGYLSTPRDEGNYVYSAGSGRYAAALAEGVYGSVKALAGEVTTQYILRFQPNVPESTALIHELKVVVNLPGVTVHSRPYYYPAKP